MNDNCIKMSLSQQDCKPVVVLIWFIVEVNVNSFEIFYPIRLVRKCESESFVSIVTICVRNCERSWVTYRWKHTKTDCSSWIKYRPVQFFWEKFLLWFFYWLQYGNVVYLFWKIEKKSDDLLLLDFQVLITVILMPSFYN